MTHFYSALLRAEQSKKTPIEPENTCGGGNMKYFCMSQHGFLNVRNCRIHSQKKKFAVFINYKKDECVGYIVKIFLLGPALSVFLVLLATNFGINY